MILSGQTIREYAKNEWLIAPFVERTQHPKGSSYGVGPASYDVRIAQDLIVRHGEFELASTLERFRMPAGVAATVHDKSTHARKGLAVQNTFIDPGWEGWLTLELSNHRHDYDIYLVEGEPIAQIVFHFLDEAAAEPYKGKYQDQPNYPVGAL